jgi:hypothetical protein
VTGAGGEEVVFVLFVDLVLFEENVEVVLLLLIDFC